MGSLIGAAFGLVFVLVNAAVLPTVAGVVARVAGVLAFLAVLAALRGGGFARQAAPPATGGLGRRYVLVLAAEVVALAAGLAVLNGPLEAGYAGVAWVALVVGIHFHPLAGLFELPVFRALGAAIAGCGVVGLVLAGLGAGAAPIAVVGGVLPGALLLAVSWWGARTDLRRPTAAGATRR